jgi:hypothetical protein
LGAFSRNFCKPRSDRRGSTRFPAAYAAAVWAFLFSVVSFYWAAGGTIGLNTLAAGLRELARTHNPGLAALAWVTGGLKVLAGVLALSLARPWGRVVPRWLLLAGAWGAGVLLAIYGAANLVEFGLMEGGVIALPAFVGATALRWYLLLWEPWFLIGGILFLAAARSFSRRPRPG